MFPYLPFVKADAVFVFDLKARLFVDEGDEHDARREDDWREEDAETCAERGAQKTRDDVIVRVQKILFLFYEEFGTQVFSLFHLYEYILVDDVSKYV